jgi:hypothetical protein
MSLGGKGLTNKKTSRKTKEAYLSAALGQGLGRGMHWKRLHTYTYVRTYIHTHRHTSHCDLRPNWHNFTNYTAESVNSTDCCVLTLCSVVGGSCEKPLSRYTHDHAIKQLSCARLSNAQPWHPSASTHALIRAATRIAIRFTVGESYEKWWELLFSVKIDNQLKTNIHEKLQAFIRTVRL